jgi:DNA polymerase elongation subunit (family B)
LEEEIENLEKFNITEKSKNILVKIKEKLKSDEWIKKYFNNKNDFKRNYNRKDIFEKIIF